MNYLCVSVSTRQSSQFSSQSGEHLLGPWSGTRRARSPAGWAEGGPVRARPSWLSNNVAGREGERVPEGSPPSNFRTGRGEKGRGEEGEGEGRGEGQGEQR